MYGSTMFDKLWEWIMGIIAWIMSKFSRSSNASNASGTSGGDSAEVVHAPSQEDDAPTNVAVAPSE